MNFFNTISILFFVLFSLNILRGQEDFLSANEIIFKVMEQTKSINSLAYDLKLTAKRASTRKPKIRNFKVIANRNPQNTAYLFDWKINEKDEKKELIHLYLEDDFYLINPIKKWMNVHQDFGKIQSGSYSDGVQKFAFFNELIFRIEYETLKKIKFSEEFQDPNYWILEIPYPMGYNVIWIDKERFLPTKKLVKVINQNLESSYFSEIQNLIINGKIPTSKFEVDKFLDSFKVNYVLKKEDNTNLTLNDLELHLSKLQGKALLNAKFYQKEGDKIQLKNQEAKLFLIDFWFLACAPCITAMPKLEKLHQQFQNEGLKVVGINWSDLENTENVLEILRKKGFSFDNYFSELTLKKELGIQAYPTIILMNSEGEILYSGVFISYEEIEELILRNL